MFVLYTCTFQEVAIKIDSAMPWTRSNTGFFSTQGQVSLYCTYWPKLELVQNFVPVLDTCMFEEVAIKSEGTMPRTRSNKGFLALKGK